MREADVIALDEFRRRRQARAEAGQAPAPQAVPLPLPAPPVVWVPVWFFMPMWLMR